jgi:hypothetical protein
LVPRGLDHVAHAVRDLDAAQELFSRANLPASERLGRLIVGPDTALAPPWHSSGIER